MLGKVQMKIKQITHSYETTIIELMVGYLGNSVTEDLSANAKSSITLA